MKQAQLADQPDCNKNTVSIIFIQLRNNEDEKRKDINITKCVTDELTAAYHFLTIKNCDIKYSLEDKLILNHSAWALQVACSLVVCHPVFLWPRQQKSKMKLLFLFAIIFGALGKKFNLVEQEGWFSSSPICSCLLNFRSVFLPSYFLN